MKRQVTSILLFSALLMGGASTFVSCKDTESDALYDSNGKVAEVIAKQAKDISDLADKLKKETEKRESEDQVLKDLIIDKSTEIKSTADEALRLAQTNESKIGDLTGRVTTLESRLSSLLGLSGKVDGLDSEVKKLKTQFESFRSCTCDFTTLNQNYEDLKLKQAEDRRRIEAIEQGKTKLDEQIGRINTTLNSKVDQTTFDDLKRQVEANERNISANETEINNLRNNFANYVEKSYLIDNYYTKAEVDNAIKNASTALEGQISALETRLTTQLNSLFNAMANEVTGVILNRFYSPILGSYKDMMGTEARFLGAYYGYAEDNAFIGNEDIQKEDLLLDDAKDNAGSIGVYINPANKNFEGLKFKIVDSQGNVTPFIATATKNDKVEHYGYTRADAENTTPNYYLLKISVDPNRLDEVKTWTSADVESLKGVAKNILNKLKDRNNNLNLTEIANTLYKTFNNRLTEYHLALEQKLTDGTNKDLNVTIADKDFAATVIKPLSYKFLSGGINYDIKDIPTLESKGLYIKTDNLKWSNLGHIDDMTQEIPIEIPDASTMTIDGNRVEITATGAFVWTQDEHGNDVKNNINDLKDVKVNVNGIRFESDAIKYNNTTKVITVTVSMAQFNNMIDDINRQVGNMLGTVENLANKVNKFESTIDGNFINRVNNYIHKCNYWLDNANKFLQPAMFATDGNNWVKLPTIASGATYVKMTNGKANVLLLPTSYTLEYLAPAYKKYITVKDPSGATVTGENIGKVISGNIHKAGFTATKEGVYTITYDAVDYTGGKAKTKTFFIKVVK
jgi:predicted  nucleic acid-binding Zn-ribbon protein